MPRQAAAAAGFATGTNGTRLLLRPPEDLDQLERVEFASLSSPVTRVSIICANVSDAESIGIAGDCRQLSAGDFRTCHSRSSACISMHRASHQMPV